MGIFKISTVPPGTLGQGIKNPYNEKLAKSYPGEFHGVELEEVRHKLQELDQAYLIMHQRETDLGAVHDNKRYKGWAGDQQANTYQSVRSLIGLGSLEEAQAILAALPEKTAQWYFLNGIILWSKGWYREGRYNIQQAVNMDYYNNEYREALHRILRAYNPFFGIHSLKHIPKKLLLFTYLIIGFLLVILMVGHLIK